MFNGIPSEMIDLSILLSQARWIGILLLFYPLLLILSIFIMRNSKSHGLLFCFLPGYFSLGVLGFFALLNLDYVDREYAPNEVWPQVITKIFSHEPEARLRLADCSVSALTRKYPYDQVEVTITTDRHISDQKRVEIQEQLWQEYRKITLIPYERVTLHWKNQQDTHEIKDYFNFAATPWGILPNNAWPKRYYSISSDMGILFWHCNMLSQLVLALISIAVIIRNRKSLWDSGIGILIGVIAITVCTAIWLLIYHYLTYFHFLNYWYGILGGGCLLLWLLNCENERWYRLSFSTIWCTNIMLVLNLYQMLLLLSIP